MRSLIYSTLFAFSVICLNAQDVTEIDTMPVPNNFIKIYKNFRYESLPDLVFNGADFNYYVERQDLFGNGFGIAFNHTKDNGNFWEIGLAEMNFAGSNKTTSYRELDSLFYQDYREVEYKRQDFYVNLAYGITLGEGDTGKWRMTAAAALMPFFQSIDVSAIDEETLPVATNIIGASLAAYPAFQFRVFKKGFLEISLPIRLLRAAGFTGESGNPFLNLVETNRNSFDVDVLPSIYELRLGLSIGL